MKLKELRPERFEEDERFKIKIRDLKHNEKVQKELFKLGLIWNSGDTEPILSVEITGGTKMEGLFFNIKDKRITYTAHTDYFEESKAITLNLTMLRNKKFQAMIKKLMILNSLGGNE